MAHPDPQAIAERALAVSIRSTALLAAAQSLTAPTRFPSNSEILRRAEVLAHYIRTGETDA